MHTEEPQGNGPHTPPYAVPLLPKRKRGVTPIILAFVAGVLATSFAFAAIAVAGVAFFRNNAVMTSHEFVSVQMPYMRMEPEMRMWMPQAPQIEEMFIYGAPFGQRFEVFFSDELIASIPHFDASSHRVEDGYLIIEGPAGGVTILLPTDTIIDSLNDLSEELQIRLRPANRARTNTN